MPLERVLDTDLSDFEALFSECVSRFAREEGPISSKNDSVSTSNSVIQIANRIAATLFTELRANV
jgi:hypothetical protein